MDVNDNADILTERGALETIAGKPAPTDVPVLTKRAGLTIFASRLAPTG